jgi:hypothetical protein
MNFLDFLNKKNNNKIFTESFNTKDLDKVHHLMLDIFKKKIDRRTVMLFPWQNETLGDRQMKSCYFSSYRDGTMRVFSINYKIEDDSANAFSISFFDPKATNDLFFKHKGTAKVTLEIETLGTSVAYFIPIICHIVKNDDYNISQERAKELGNELLYKGTKNESYIWNYGAAKYRVYENLTDKDVDDIFYLNEGYIQEATEAQNYRWQKKTERDEAFRKAKTTRKPEDKEEYERIQREYQEIVNAIRGGATTIEEVKMRISKGVSVILDISDDERRAQERLDKEGKDPKQAFKEMSVYVKTVINGLQPGVIICGAPGIGKTYKIMKQLEASGYRDGHNMEIIKGKATPRQLYLSLYNYKEKGNILVIDDADALVGPKAPEDCINMLKAALDSTSTPEGRKVSYRVTGTLYDDDGIEIPKTLYYKGGVIVITNYSVGQLDTALRGRTFVQELDFSNEQLLQIIEDMIDNLGDGMISMTAKNKALDYLKELARSGADMEISIRTFNTCARLFAVCENDPDMTDDDVKSMIKEQMKNQSLRGGQKF